MRDTRPQYGEASARAAEIVARAANTEPGVPILSTSALSASSAASASTAAEASNAALLENQAASAFAPALVPTYTTAGRPAAGSTTAGKIIRVKDVGAPEQLQVCCEQSGGGVWEWVIVGQASV